MFFYCVCSVVQVFFVCVLGSLLESNGLHLVLEMFAAMIQSGKDVFIDQGTKLKVYTFSRPNIVGVHTRFYTANMSEFLRNSKSVVEIKNDRNNMCFSFAFVLGLAHLKEDKSLYKRFCKHGRNACNADLWTQLAVGLHCDVLDLDVQSMATWREFKLLEQHHQLAIHVYNISGVKPHFTYHTSRSFGFTKHLYFLQIGHHVHYVTNMLGLIRNFGRSGYLEYCEGCYKIYDRRYVPDSGHVCDAENEDDCVEEKMCTIGNRVFPYFPKIGLARSLNPQFIERTEVKEKNNKKIIYLDFETTVVGYSHEGVDTNTRRLEPPIPSQNLPISSVFEYEPYPFIPRIMDTTNFEYVQTVNHCEAQDEDGTVFVFKNIEETMSFLNEDQNKGAVVIAHCGGLFDFQLLMRQFLVCGQLRLKKVKAPLMRGNKIISAKICNDITLLDSYAFVTCALSKFPKIFSIEEERKGFFPHLFNRVEFYNYRGPIPSFEWYDPDTFSVEKRKEFFEWYEEQVAKGVFFDFEREMRSYCHSDVQLLRLGMQKFRELFLNLQKGDGSPIGVDPFNHITIPSVAFEGIYLKYFLPEQTLITVPRPSQDKHSFKSILWMEYLMKTNVHFIQHARNLGEFEVTLRSGKRVKVDGYCQDTNTVYQFHGCFWHGCCYCYEGDAPTPHRYYTYINKKGEEVKKPIKFGELYTYTFQMSENFRQLGYKVVEMWECQWDIDIKKMKIETNRPDLEHHKPLVPRDAYFGGRVNAVKLYYKCIGDEIIEYLDITSMYPYVMSADQYDYPIKVPSILKKGRDILLPIEELFGLIKCKIRPPRTLYFPVLPERSSDNSKVLFHLNEMVGTWTSVEVQKAVQKGYEILDIYEQHHFSQKSNQLFREYNETFFEIKRQAKQEGNKGLEAIAKMCINGPTGKWGFNPEKQKGTRLVTECDEFYNYLCGSWDKVNINVITDEAATVTVEENSPFTEHMRSNVYISAFITSYARLKLYDEALDPLKNMVLYFDTDSVIYVSPTGEHLIPVDTTGEMGLWTSEAEAGDFFIEFVSCGPKTYALKSKSGKRDISKSKGFSLHYTNQQKFNFDSLKEQVLYKALGEDLDSMVFEERMEAQNKKPRLEKLTLHMNETIMRRKKFQVLVEENKGKIINLTYDKRKILNPDENYEDVTVIDTRPWGHDDIHEYMHRIQNI